MSGNSKIVRDQSHETGEIKEEEGEREVRGEEGDEIKDGVTLIRPSEPRTVQQREIKATKSC